MITDTSEALKEAWLHHKGDAEIHQSDNGRHCAKLAPPSAQVA